MNILIAVVMTGSAMVFTLSEASLTTSRQAAATGPALRLSAKNAETPLLSNGDEHFNCRGDGGQRNGIYFKRSEFNDKPAGGDDGSALRLSAKNAETPLLLKVE